MLLKVAAKTFEEDRKYKNLSKTTIDSYMLTISEFYQYCFQYELINVEDITPQIIKSYLLYCEKERGNNETTRNSKLHSLKIFFNYLQNEEFINEKLNPTKKVPYIKEEIKIEVFSDDQIRQMTSYLLANNKNKEFASFRNYIIIKILLGTGIRLGELVNLTWDSINFDKKIITVYGKKRALSSIPIVDQLIDEIKEYKLFCENTFNKLSDFVIVSYPKNGKISLDGIKNVFMRLKKDMNFKNVRLSAHTFRHTFAHRMILAGCDVFTLQKMLRHSNIAMTQKYVSMWGTALQEQNEKFNPLNNLFKPKKEVKMAIKKDKTKFPFDVNSVKGLSGIYQLKNFISNKAYVGKATNIENRWKQHYKLLVENAHKNKKLQDEWNEFGEAAFIFEVLEVSKDNSSLSIMEKYWTTKLKHKMVLYNISEPMEDSSFQMIFKLQNQIKQLEEKLLNVGVTV